MPECGVLPKLINEEDASDYAFVGDISDVRIITLSFSSCIVGSFHHQNILIEDFYSTNLMFFLTPSQYINLSHAALDCSLSCFINSDSKRKKNKQIKNHMPTIGT